MRLHLSGHSTAVGPAGALSRIGHADQLIADEFPAYPCAKHAVAEEALASQISASVQNPRLLLAAEALCEDRIPIAEALLREHLKQFPTEQLRLLRAATGPFGTFCKNIGVFC